MAGSLVCGQVVDEGRAASLLTGNARATVGQRPVTQKARERRRTVPSACPTFGVIDALTGSRLKVSVWPHRRQVDPRSFHFFLFSRVENASLAFYNGDVLLENCIEPR